jgi:predicted AAA+ superfamily ATPase
MAFLSGARQVGKTTAARSLATQYLSWDNMDDRHVMQHGTGALADAVGLGAVSEEPPIVVLDEIHKYSRWKTLVKGFYDSYGERAKIIVTGSARLDDYRRGGDSIMGRYRLYRVHPWSVAECVRTDVPPEENFIREPSPVDDDDWAALLQHGGFPEPFIMRDNRTSRQWRRLLHEQLAKEDLRELSRVQELGAIETLMLVLAGRSGGQLVFSNLSNELGVAVDTVKRWVELLVRLHHGFLVRPWFTNVAKALRKEPKWYLRDWSGIADAGGRAETLVACHLLKAVEGWTDLGFGTFELRYLRDKMKRKVDFIVIRDGKPWFMVEAKQTAAPLSPALAHFQKQTNAKHAFQVELDAPFVAADCFAQTAPVRVPARTLFSQLL